MTSAAVLRALMSNSASTHHHHLNNTCPRHFLSNPFSPTLAI
jgi:hypothetical protein